MTERLKETCLHKAHLYEYPLVPPISRTLLVEIMLSCFYKRLLLAKSQAFRLRNIVRYQSIVYEERPWLKRKDKTVIRKNIL
jgi:hypothetical protein